jgi:hypothetical protein
MSLKGPLLDKIKSTDRVQKKWIAQQLQRASRLKTLTGMRKYQNAILNMLLPDEEAITAKSVSR